MAYEFTQALVGNWSSPSTWHSAYNITAVSTGSKTFTIATDHHEEFPAGCIIKVAGSTGNNGTYTVVSAVFGTSTVITVTETVPSAVADGNVQSQQLPQDTGYSTSCVIVGDITIDVVIAEGDTLTDLIIQNGTGTNVNIIGTGNDAAKNYFQNVTNTTFTQPTTITDLYFTNSTINNNTDDSGAFQVTLTNCSIAFVGGWTIDKGCTYAMTAGDIQLDGGNLSIKDDGLLSCNGVRFLSANELDFDSTGMLAAGPQMIGTIDFVNGVPGPYGENGPFTFGANGSVFTFRTDVAINTTNGGLTVMLGTYILYGSFAMQSSWGGDIGPSFVMMVGGKNVTLPSGPTSCNLIYSGPTGGSMGNFSLSL